MKPRGDHRIRRLALVSFAVALAWATPAGTDVRTYPPQKGGIAGSSGPLADEYIPFGIAGFPAVQGYWSFDGTEHVAPYTVPTWYGWDSGPATRTLIEPSVVAGGPSVASGSFAFHGRSVYIRGNDSASYFERSGTDFRMSGSFSVSFWARYRFGSPADNEGNQVVFQAGIGAAVSDYAIDFPGFANNVRLTYYDSTAGSGSVSGGALNSTYKHLVFVYRSNSKDAILYVNGVAGAAGAALSNGLKQTSTDLVVMREASGIDSATIMIDELAFFPSELSAGNVGSLYSSGAGRFY